MIFQIKTISIVLSLLLVALCAGTSYQISAGLRQVATLSTLIGSDDIATLQIGEEIKSAFVLQRRAEAKLAASGSPSDLKSALEERQSAKDERLKWWDKFETVLRQHNSAEQALVALRAEFSTYDTLGTRLESLAREQSGDASALFRGEMVTSEERLGSLLDQVIKAKTRSASERLQEVKALALAVCSGAAWAMAIVSGFAVVFLVYAVWRIANPLSQLAVSLGHLANDVLDTEIPSTHLKNEIGDTARAVALIKIRDNEKAAREVEAREAAARASSEERKEAMVKLADNFHEAVIGVIDTVLSASGKLEKAAGILSATAEVTQELSSMAAFSSSETSSNVKGVATASEALASTVEQIGRQVQDSSAIATRAVEQASKTNERMVELAESANRIGNVVDLINSIAGQTNLLALNATIEAARAGEAGRGFAVVAQEVKALAEQTAKATSEISTQIATMQSATNEAVSAIRDIAVTISRISSISGEIASAVDQQGVMTREISTNVADAARGTANVESSITDVSMGASETTTASAEVLASAKRLANESNSLRDQVDQFLEAVRAA